MRRSQKENTNNYAKSVNLFVDYVAATDVLGGSHSYFWTNNKLVC